jgi:tetratricopeptide (TPR) repeat protein
MRWWHVPLILGAVLAALQIARIGRADMLADHDPDAALASWSVQTEAQARKVQALVAEDGGRASAAALAKTMLSTKPLSGAAYGALARVSAEAGDLERARRLFEIAARRSPRERLLHAWLADDRVGSGDFAGALDHLDQIMRLSPRTAHSLFPTLGSISQQEDGRRAVAQWLGSRAPKWRSRFLGWWASQSQHDLIVDELFDPLRRADVPLTSEERSIWIARLVRLGRIGRAYYIWIDGLGGRHREMLGNVFDGGFELPPEDGGFGWRIGKVPGASIRRQGGAGVDGKLALMIEFQNRRVAFQHVQQMLALPAGPYQLSGRYRLDDLRTDRGLVWQVTCLPKGNAIAESQPFLGRKVWESFDVSFSVPPESCPAQMLVLRSSARVAAERWIGGRAWFDSLRLVRKPASTADQS